MTDRYRDRLIHNDLNSHPLTRPAAFQGPGSGPVRLTIKPEDFEYPEYDNWGAVPEDVRSNHNDFILGPTTPQGRELSAKDQSGSFTKLGYIKDPSDFELPEREAEFQQFYRSSETSSEDDGRGDAAEPPATETPTQPIEAEATTGPETTAPSDAGMTDDAGAETTTDAQQPTRRPTTPEEAISPSLEPKERSAVGDFVAEVPVNVYAGVYRAAREFNEFLGVTPVVDAISNLEAVRAVVPEAARGAPPEASNAGGQLVQEAARFATGFIPANATFKALGMVNNYVRMGIAGMASDFAFMDPQEEGVAEMLRDMGASDNLPVEAFRQAVTAAFATSADNTEFENRLRQSLGGYVAGEALSGLVSAGGAAFRYLKNASIMPDSAKKTILDQAEKSAARQAQRYPDGSSPVGAGIDPVNTFDKMMIQMAEVIKNSDISSRAFYSALERNFEPFLNNNYHASQWKGIIKNFQNKGVRAAEIKWSGIEDWLDGQSGKISGRAVRDQIKSRLPVIEPTDRFVATQWVPIEDGPLPSELKEKFLRELEAKEYYTIDQDKVTELFLEITKFPKPDSGRFLRDAVLRMPPASFERRLWSQLTALTHSDQYGLGAMDEDLAARGFPPIRELADKLPQGAVPQNLLNALNIYERSNFQPDYVIGLSEHLGREITPKELGWVHSPRPSLDEPSFVLKNSPEDTRAIINDVMAPLRFASDKEVSAKGFPDRQSYDQLLADLDNYFEDFIENPDRSVSWKKINKILRELGARRGPLSSGFPSDDDFNVIDFHNLAKTNPSSRLGLEEEQLAFSSYTMHHRALREAARGDLSDGELDTILLSDETPPDGYAEFTYRWENVPDGLKTSDPHFEGDDIIANSISYEVKGPEGKRYLFVDEIQSTPFQQMTDEERAAYPISSTWAETVLRHMVRRAAELDLDGVILSTKQDNVNKHGESVAKLFKFLYEDKGPSVLKKTTGDKNPRMVEIRTAGEALSIDEDAALEIFDRYDNPEAMLEELMYDLENATFEHEYPVYRLDPETKRKVLSEGVPLWGAGAGLAALGSEESFTGEEYQEASLLGEVLEQAIKSVSPQRSVPSVVRNAPTSVVDFSTLTDSGDIQRSLNTYSSAFTGYETGEKVLKEEELATMLGSSVNHTRWLHGGAVPDDVLYSKIQILNDSVRQVDYYSKLASDSPTVENLANWVSQWRTHRAIAESLAGRHAVADTELSRFGPGRPGSGTVRQQEILEEFGGKGFAEYQLGLYSELKDAAAKSTFIRSSMWSRTKDAVYGAWINGLLSNPATQVVNFASTAAFMGFRVPERLVAGMMPGGDITPGEAPLMAAGYVHGTIDMMRLGKLFATDNMFADSPGRQYADFRKYLGQLGFDDAYRKLEAGEKYNVISSAAFEQDGYVGAGIDMLGWALTWPGRALQLTDATTKAVAYRGELYALAYRHAHRVLKETGDQTLATQAFNDAINFPSETMHKAAVESARVVTFTQELGEIGKSFEGLVNHTFMGRFFIPFVRTPANLLKSGFRRTAGVNLLTPSMWADIRAGGTRRQEAMAALGVSSSLAAVAAYMASEGLLTGTVDFDNRAYYQQLSLSGKQRYSVKVGEDYYSVGRFEPLATPLAIWADAYHVMSYINDPEDRELIANAAVASVVEVVRQKAFLQSFSGLADVVFAKDASNISSLLEREIGRQAGSLVPNVVSKSGPAFEMMGLMENDPNIRITDVDEDLFDESMIGAQTFYRVLNEVIARTPGLSDDLPPLRGAFGGPIKRGQGTLADMFSPFYYSEGKYSKIGKELEKLGTYVSLPPSEYMGVKLGPELRDRLNVIRANEVIVNGRNFQEHLEYVISNPMYLNLPTEELKVMELRAEISDFNQMAMELLVRENPKIEERAQKLELQLYGVE